MLKVTQVARLGGIDSFCTVAVTKIILPVMLFLALPLAASAQTFTGGVQIYPGLTNATVTMTGRTELRITGTNNPLSGCNISLNSPDAWLILQNIRPSVVNSTYLSQVKVNGASAVVGSNCRLDQYAMGTVIVPQAPSYTPLQVFSGPNFLGTSASYGTYTYYTNNALGAMRWNISSFKLKRGYSATFAQYPDGTGASKVFVAQDGDLEVGVLPANLDHQCNFVRVFPWRWTSKKGWGGGVNTQIDAEWNYDWNNAATSTLDTEYIPMKWGGFTTWDPYSNLNSKQKSTQVLGYNEPDSTAQANVSVSDAIALWPQLMQSGLRLGAPAVSDSGVSGQGLDWLYSFMSQANALNYRVDYVPVHFYKCAWTSTQLYNYLLGIYQQTGKPVWVTEFNYGADWCGDVPSQATTAANISSYLSVLENAPFVERYAIYSYFATNRAMIVNSVLTPAGTNYLKQQSGLAYAQALPNAGSRSLAQFQFETNTFDSSGYGNNGLAVGIPSYPAGHSGQAVALDGTNNYILLPPNIGNSANFTFAAWVYWNGGAQWQRIFDFGDDTTHYMFLSPSSGGNTLRFAITTNGTEQRLEAPQMTAGVWTHVAVTLSGTSGKLYTNGVLAASATITINPANFNPNINYLGKSQFADPLFRGNLDEVQIADYAMTAGQIASLLTNTPPQFTTNILASDTAPMGTPYSGSISGTATDVDPGDTLTYSKAGGPAWLVVAADGTLSGTPGPTDGGTNNFTLRVTDAAGASAFAMMTITTPFTTGNGTWFVDGNGNWSDTTKWTRACVANGVGLIADFSILDITADRTVTLDSSRSIGGLKFLDYSGSQAWTVAASGGSVLTLDMGSATSPSIVVGTSPTIASASTATISAGLGGTNGLTKSGWGTLILTGGNSLSGTLNVDSASTTLSDGAVRLGSAGAGTNLTAINIRNNNGGSSTLQLAGGAQVPANVSLSGRNANVAGIENLSGSNNLSGNVTINSGGGYYLLQSDAGTLNYGGVVSSAAGGTRNFTFQGAGDHYVSGSIQNGSATTLNVVKQDAGNLILANANAFTGTMNVAGGSAKFIYPRALENNSVNLACAATNALKFGPITGASVANLSGIGDVWLTNASLAAVMLTNGNSANTEYAGALRGSGGPVKTGTGTLTLDGTNNYTGATVISVGTVRFSQATNFIANLLPVLWMSFDQAGNGVVTNQGTGGWSLNGALIGTGAYITNAGRFGSALYINGSGTTTAANIVQINSKVVDTSVSGSWTISYWVKTSTAGAVIMYQGDGGWSSSGQTTYLLNSNSGGTAGTHAGAVRWGGGFLTGTATLNDGNWHCITMVDSVGSESIYVDGNVDAVTSTMANALAAGANQTWIGGAPDTDAGAVKMTGMIDEVCMFNRALTAAEIRGIYTNAPTTGKLPATTPVSISSGATLDLNGYSQSIGSLADSPVGAGVVTNGGAVPVTLTLAGNGSPSTFSGVIADRATASAISLVKNGIATETLAGNNNYRGTTTVNTGALLVNGQLGTNSVSVTSGKLGGSGVIPGAVLVANGTLAPGNNAVGILTVNNNVTLQAGSTTLIELDKTSATNDQLRVNGTLNYGGTLSVANLSAPLAGGDTFQLFSATSATGNFLMPIAGSPGTDLDWKFNPSNGVLTVYSTLPINLNTVVMNNSLQITWPADHLGWLLQVQTNDLSSGLGTNWFPVDGSTTNTQFLAPLDVGNASVFYRLIYQ